MLHNWSLQKIVIAALTRGAVLTDRENPYSIVSSTANDSISFKPSIISRTMLESLGKITDLVKSEVGNSSLTMIPNSAAFAHVKGGKKPSLFVPPKRLAKLRLSYIPSGSNFIGAGSKDGGIGVPTFAVISAENQIKTAAERALQLISLYLGNYPSNGSCFGVTKLHSGWKELNKCASLTRLQNKLKDLPDARFMFPEEYNFIRYFAFEKSIIGIVELPSWSCQSFEKHPVPSIAFITINPEGKYSWIGNFQYEENPRDSNTSRDRLGSLNLAEALDHGEVFEKWRSLIAAQKSSQSSRILSASKKSNPWPNYENIPTAQECQLPEHNYKYFEKDIIQHCDLEDSILKLSSKSRQDLQLLYSTNVY